MIPTVPFDLLFSLLVGLVFAGCARQQFSGGAAPWGRELAAVLLFQAIVLWPVALYYYLVYPDWSWMYFVDARRLPAENSRPRAAITKTIMRSVMPATMPPSTRWRRARSSAQPLR